MYKTRTVFTPSHPSGAHSIYIVQQQQQQQQQTVLYIRYISMKLFARHFGLHTHTRKATAGRRTYIQKGGKKLGKKASDLWPACWSIRLCCCCCCCWPGLLSLQTRVVFILVSWPVVYIYRVIAHTQYIHYIAFSLSSACVCVCVCTKRTALCWETCATYNNVGNSFCLFHFRLSPIQIGLFNFGCEYLNGRCSALLLFDPSKGK